MKSESNNIKLAFVCGGGAGSLFLQANFIFCVKNYLMAEPVSIVAIGHKSTELNDLVFGDNKVCDQYFASNEQDIMFSCDAIIQINMYPFVSKLSDRVLKTSKKTYDLLEGWKNFVEADASRVFCQSHPYYDEQAYVHAIINNRNCVNIFDLEGKLGMTREYEWHPNVPDDFQLLKKYELETNKYITLQMGATPGIDAKNSPKIWPKEYYAKLIIYLKKVYPDFKIVQLGELTNSEPICGVDIDMLGKTNWIELGIILKNAWLHIDGECGMVHFRKAMGVGPSVVLFGATPVDFYGYDNNINIISNSCKHWCARLTESWQVRCVLGDEVPRCMTSIRPEEVIRRIVYEDRLNRVKENREAYKFINDELYNDNRINIEDKYKNDYIERTYLFYYGIESIRIGDLLAHFPVSGKFMSKPLSESPTFSMAKGDVECYSKYVEGLRNSFGDDIHSIEKCSSLYKKLEQEGFNKKHYILVDENNMILDGQHRASWMMAKYGSDYECEVVRLLSLKEDERGGLFPFEMLPRDSRLIIYGAGISGFSYVKELKLTGYARLMRLIDIDPYKWNRDYEKREMIICENRDVIKSMSNSDYDYIILALQNKSIANTVRNWLLNNGVDHNKIIGRML